MLFRSINDKLCAIFNPLTLINDGNEIIRKEKKILFVGRIEFGTKRVDLLLKIWDKLSRLNPDWSLHIVGTGSDYEEMKSIIRNKKIPNVFIHGRKDPTELYKKSSILCLTSSYEGFGLVLTEAMTFGTIPFAFNSYASAGDIISNEKDGYLITPFDIEEYSSKIQLLINNENLRNQISRQALLKSNTFHIDKISKQWVQLFNMIK